MPNHNPQYRNAILAAQVSPTAFRLEMQKPTANPNARELITENVQYGDYLIHGLIFNIRDDILPEYLQVLVDAGVNLEVENWTHKRPLALAAFLQKRETVIFLANQKVSTDSKLKTPILYALARSVPGPDKLALFSLLVQNYHIQIDAASLQELITQSDFEILKYIQQQTTTLNCANISGLFALAYKQLQTLKKSKNAVEDILIVRATECLNLIVGVLYKIIFDQVLKSLTTSDQLEKCLDTLLEQVLVSARCISLEEKNLMKSYLNESIASPMINYLKTCMSVCTGLKETPNSKPNSKIYAAFFNNAMSISTPQIFKEIFSYLPGNPTR